MVSTARTSEARALQRRLLALAVGGLFGPLLVLLALAGWRDLEAQRSLVAVRAAEDGEARGREAARELAREIEAALEAEDREPGGVGLLLDAQGRVLAPSLPAASGTVSDLAAETRAALQVGRTLEHGLEDRVAAREHYRALVAGARTPARRAAAALELLGTCAALADWPAVRGTADALLEDHARQDGALLGRTEYLHVQLLRLDALRALGEPALAREVAGRVLLELRLAESQGPISGSGFFRTRLLEHGPAALPEWVEPLERALRSSRVPGPLAGEPPGSTEVLSVERLASGHAVVGLIRLDTEPARFRLLLLPLGPRLEKLDGLARQGISWRLLAPDGSTIHTAGRGASDRARQVPLGVPLPGWTLEVSAAPAASALDRQAWILAGLVGAALLVLATAVVLLLRDASRAVDLARVRADLVAGVAHDLKTPLSMIRLYAETLRLGRVQDETEQARYLDVVMGEVDRLTDLVDDALQAARGATALRKDATDLAASVREAAAGFEPVAGERLRLAFRTDLPAVPHDPQAVRRIVRNLLGNALKFAPPGTPVDVVLEAGEGGGVRLVVRDRGPGIPADALARLGEPGFRPSPGAAPGTGLGLMVVRQLAEGHGGRFEVESAEGQGTSAAVVFPA